MIKIEGVTQRQKQIMDLLWNCESMEALQALIKAMPTKRDQQDAQSLTTIMIWAAIEQERGLDEYKDLADRCVAHARLH